MVGTEVDHIAKCKLGTRGSELKARTDRVCDFDPMNSVNNWCIHGG